jgi:mRNA deadenylase 3'-5' endonuclease subunit Ccr4
MQSPSPKKASVKKAKESTRETPQRGRSATRRGKQEDKHDEDEKADVDEEDETKQEAGEKSDAENLEVKTAVSETDAVDGGHVGSETAEPTEQSETSKDDTADSAVDEKVEEGKKTEGTSQPKEGPEVDTMEKMEVEVGSCGTGQKRKREDEEDGETGVEAKVMKVSDESNGLDKESAMDVKQAEVPAGVEAVSTDVAGGATESSELDADLLDSEYIVISTDDVPAADSDEMAQVASKMAVAVEPTTTAVTTDGLCSSANGENCSGDEDPILSRTFVVNPAVSESVAVGTSQSFSLVSYNVLADCHAQKDYAGDRAPWITDEQLVMASRHKRILEELIYLDADVICLQEVAGDYLSDLLQPALESRGYKGVFIPRNTKQYCEGEATFYRTNRFTLVSSEGLLLGDLIGAAIDESSGLEADKKELVKNSLSTHAVAMLTRLKSVDADDCVTIANIHVVYDKLERQDRQCLQIATAVQKLIELAGGVDKSHIICGDFNSWPGTPPYQLMTDGSLNETSLIALQGIESIDAGEEQFLPVVNLWSDGFQFPIGGDLKSAYLTVLGEEPLTSRYAADARVLPLDYIWFSSVSLDVLGVLKVVDRELIESGIPTAVFPSDHLSIKARFAFK